jgi:hypothetical protein
VQFDTLTTVLTATGAPLIVSGVLGVGEIAVGAYQYQHANKTVGDLNMIAGGLGLLAAAGAATGHVEIAVPAAILGGVAVSVNLVRQASQQRQQNA